MPDVELGQMRDLVNESDIPVIDAMAGVDLKFCAVRMPRTLTQAIQLLRLDFFCERVRQFARMQFDHFRSQFRCAVDLFFIGINKETDADAIGMEPLDGIGQVPTAGDGIQPAFCRNFRAFLRNKTNFIWSNPNGDVEDFGRVAHFKIQFCHNVGPQAFHVAVLNMASIGT